MGTLSTFTCFFVKKPLAVTKRLSILSRGSRMILGVMLKTTLIQVYSAFLLVALIVGTTSAAPVKEQADTVKLDAVVKDFTLQDAAGTHNALHKLSEGKPATVVLFLATQCPIATDYAERIVTLFNKYNEKKVQFIGINANKQETVEEIAKYNEKYGFEFPVLKDPENKIADYFAARRTPEVFLLDKERILRYRGAIDNSRDEPTQHYLQTALDLVIEGQDIPKESKKTRAVGCTIKRVRKANLNRTP